MTLSSEEDVLRNVHLMHVQCCLSAVFFPKTIVFCIRKKHFYLFIHVTFSLASLNYAKWFNSCCNHCYNKYSRTFFWRECFVVEGRHTLINSVRLLWKRHTNLTLLLMIWCLVLTGMSLVRRSMWPGVLRLSPSLAAACSPVTVEVKRLVNRTHLRAQRDGREPIVFED